MTIQHRSAERSNPLFSSVLFPKFTPVALTLTTSGGVITLTAAQALSGVVTVDCQDTQTLTLPTAALLNAAIIGVDPGISFQLDIINYGDATLTIGLGTGITKTTIASVAAVMTLAPLSAKRFVLNCTGVVGKNGAIADAWVVWVPASLDTTGSLALGALAANAKAILDLTSTTLGFLPPRMTGTQRDAITAPPEGLVIYNTSTHKLNVFTTGWEAVTSA